jgi:hypothetical protein
LRESWGIDEVRLGGFFGLKGERDLKEGAERVVRRGKHWRSSHTGTSTLRERGEVVEGGRMRGRETEFL